eukprot:CAMPEP_0202816182 /NCGR_PEP_ID=MMETSP1389-20130828/6779_1 /ASSEMBLY_ACC=CAM_ASM_000865 /TAXON_ID=302021 /ORGANISM="Rhodomonas sp., Strain CCMP768" /LENGTH=446 /DNA_ID=CAMNT_0049488211 /DNA_START=178 /DNA_END=1518 /DNA_ORIENTATION=-
MCSFLVISTVLLVPTLFVSTVFFKFVNHGNNEAVMMIKTNLERVSSKAETARGFLNVEGTAVAFDAVYVRNDLSDCSTSTCEFEEAVAATVHAAADAVFDAASKLFSWNFFSVLGLVFNEAFQQRVQALAAEVFSLVKIKSEGELEEIIANNDENVPQIFTMLEAKALKNIEPIRHLLQNQTDLLLAEVQERGEDPDFVERVEAGVSAEQVWKHLFGRIGDDKSAISKQLKDTWTESFCYQLRDELHKLAVPIVTDISHLAVMLERLGAFRANESLDAYKRDFELAYAAVENETSGATKRTLELVKRYVDIHDKSLISKQEYQALLKALSDPVALLGEVKEAVKEVVSLAFAAKTIQRLQLTELEAAVKSLEEEDAPGETQDDQEAFKFQSVGGGKPDNSSESKAAAEAKLLQLRVKIRDVRQRNVCDVVKGHAIAAFPGLREHCD